MRVTNLVLLASVLLSGQAMRAQEKVAAMNQQNTSVNKLTPVLLVDEIEPCVKFWRQLGFEKTIEVPEGNKLGFVILQKGNVEVMYQSYASVQKDVPSNPLLSKRGPTFLYVEVASLNDTMAAMKGAEIVMPVRDTFYGAKEIGYKDPGGHMITFAQMGAAQK
ncbi:MAG TPA: VOC family protein [Terriglobales bacterium]|nr:VOC family protein [Terriglobales bacterium]